MAWSKPLHSHVGGPRGRTPTNHKVIDICHCFIGWEYSFHYFVQEARSRIPLCMGKCNKWKALWTDMKYKALFTLSSPLLLLMQPGKLWPIHIPTNPNKLMNPIDFIIRFVSDVDSKDSAADGQCEQSSYRLAACPMAHIIHSGFIPFCNSHTISRFSFLLSLSTYILYCYITFSSCMHCQIITRRCKWCRRYYFTPYPSRSLLRRLWSWWASHREHSSHLLR